MRRLIRLVSVSILSLGLGVAAGCKTTTSGGSRSARAERKPTIPGLPKPLKLPAQPAAAVHVGSPIDALATLAAYTNRELEPQALLGWLVASAGSGIETALVAHVDTRRPWDAAIIDGQTIVYVPIARDQLDAVENLLADKPAVGKFGAVDLQRPAEQPGPRLAWLDREAAAVTLAETLEGLATGRELAGAYGKQPLLVTFDVSQLDRFVQDVPLGRVTVVGKGLHDFELTAEEVAVDRPELAWVADGALTGMLESPQIALGLSTRYAKHDELVRGIIAQASHQVSRQNFLVRGTLEDMLRRGSSVLRSWNGRVLAGVGPSRHLLLAFGTDDTDKAQNATLHLVRGIIDNLNLAKTFGVSVPNVRFAKNKTSAAGTQVHVVALTRARNFLPAEAAPLIDQRGDLRIAMSFPKRAGGAMLVVGPDASNALARWLGQIDKATPEADSVGDLLAATLAVSPEALAPVLRDQTGRAALQLGAEVESTRVVVRRSGQTWTMAVKGPAGVQRRVGTRAPVPTARPGGRPAIPPGVRPSKASKPIR